MARTSKSKESRFARIDNVVLQDKRLSFRARGVLAYVLSLPKTWEHAADRMSGDSVDGVDAIRSALRELQAAGYATLRRVRGQGGHVANRWFFTESPSREKAEPVAEAGRPSLPLPDAVSPDAVKADCNKQRSSETTIVETTVRKVRKEETSIAPAKPGPTAATVSKLPKLGTVRNPRPLPATDAEVLAFSGPACVPDKVARAFIIYQKSNGWAMDGRPLIDWQRALLAWAKTDMQRVVKLDGMKNDAFWKMVQGMVDKGETTYKTASAWVKLMEKKNWRLENKLTGRMEPVCDIPAAFRAFVDSELNQCLEEKGIR